MNIPKVKVLVPPSTMFKAATTTDAITFNNYMTKTFILECGAGDSADTTLSVEGSKVDGTTVNVPFVFGEVGESGTAEQSKSVPVGGGKSYYITVDGNNTNGSVSIKVKFTKIDKCTTVGSLTMIETNPRYAD